MSPSSNRCGADESVGTVIAGLDPAIRAYFEWCQSALNYALARNATTFAPGRISLNRRSEMPLLPIFATNPSEINALDIRQIVALCENGRLTDGSECSQELRVFLKRAPSPQLFSYIETCLNESFDKSGQVLQDIVNELGRRLDFDVQNGAYSGRSNSIGFDGIWHVPNEQSVIVEVKTTDAYRINLDTLASYRNRLIDANEMVRSSSSILIVVGRQDTGDLEAQVRGSRHAWDIRLISADSLIKLVKIKESAEEGTVTRIRELLIPFEYTRVDRIIELAFTAVTEVGEGLEKEAAAFEDEVADADEVSTVVKLIQQRTPRDIIEQLRSKIITALSAREGAPLIKKSQALYWSPEDNLEFRVACTISKRYERTEDYWYAYHPDWDRFLTDAQKGYLVLGCVDLSTAFVIPRDWIYNKLDELYVSKGSNSPYWHIVLIKDGDHMVLKTRTGGLYPISQFATNVAGVNT